MKTNEIKQHIETNKAIITELLSGESCRRLNTLNWLRYELTNEAKTLFYMPTKNQRPFLDYNNIKNLGNAYDYILEHKDQPLTELQICVLHSILCKDTHINGSQYRTTDKVLEITVKGERMHAPDCSEISGRISQILYHLGNSKIGTLSRAFNLHYDLIALQPFDDFNKRTARMAMNWVIIRGGYRPIIFNHRTDKQEYIAAIAAAANGNTKAYSHYMYSCMLRTQQAIIKMLNHSQII